VSERDSDSDRLAAAQAAARLLARRAAPESEDVIQVLLRDPRSSVREAMVAALLEARREAAIPLLLRCLGQDRAGGQNVLEGLLDSELDGLDVRGKIADVVTATGDRDEIVGALSAIGWLAPGGGFPASAALLQRVRELAESPDEPIRVLAQAALAALAAP
jgi:HEAT repeat protein